MQENRIHSRHRLEVEVTLQSDDNFYSGITGDVSEGGLFVATFMPPPIGAQIELVAKLPSGALVKAIGEVRWVRDGDRASDGNPAGCGVRFVEIAEDTLDAIRRFVSAERDTIFYDDAA